MKHLTRITTLLLCALLLFSLCACDSAEKLIGTWETTFLDTEETARGLLEALDFYDEEIMVVDLTTLKSIKCVSFSEDGTYRFYFEEEGTVAFVREYLEEVFADLYANLDVLAPIYEGLFIDVEQMSETEFYENYAALLGEEDFESLLDYCSENAYDADSLVVEKGTYRVSGDDIWCIIEGEDVEENMCFSFVGNDSLTLEYSDAREVYRRIK